ncbi:hypothetical protein NW851_01180 [Synechococcus sp. H55.7]|uniref:hypothetical protein n=1 Tax=unclassified Synechococcus TaxID=2626047 RepID=UPI0039C158A0
MRLALAIVLGCLAAGLPVGSAFAQIAYPSYPVGDALDEILLDRGKDVDPVIFPEEVVRSQARRTTAFFTTLLNQRANIPPLRSLDLPSPYQASVRTQAGYYRVTQTEPVLDSEILR